MNKNLIIILSIVGLLIVLGIGWAGWYVYSNPQIINQGNPITTNTNTNTTNNNTQPGMPIVKTDSVTAPYISTVVVKGTVNPNGAITTYWYEYGETNALGAKSSNYLVGSGYSNIYTPAYITGLKSNTNYHFKLSAKNNLGTVSGTTYSFKTNTTPAPEGTAPTINTNAATNIERVSANLNGKINPKGLETNFWFEYGLSSDLGAITSFQLTDSNNASLPVSASISNLQPLTKYYFRLNANNQFGTTNGEIMNFITKGPLSQTAPTVNSVSATAVTGSSAKLNTSIKTNGSLTTYWFEYSKNALLSGALLKSPELSLNDDVLAVNISTNIINLDSGTKYYFRVVAKNQNGTTNSSIESFTTNN